jgi:hypothetical protein
MDKPMHTPLPWYAKVIDGEDEIHITTEERSNAHRVPIAVIQTGFDEPFNCTQIGNAELIITAVKRTPAFEAMVEAATPRLSEEAYDAIDQHCEACEAMDDEDDRVLAGGLRLLLDREIKFRTALKLAKAETPAPQDEGVRHFLTQGKF